MYIHIGGAEGWLRRRSPQQGGRENRREEGRTVGKEEKGKERESRDRKRPREIKLETEIMKGRGEERQGGTVLGRERETEGRKVSLCARVCVCVYVHAQVKFPVNTSFLSTHFPLFLVGL